MQIIPKMRKIYVVPSTSSRLEILKRTNNYPFQVFFGTSKPGMMSLMLEIF